MQSGRFGHLAQIELHDRFVGLFDVELVLFLFDTDEFRLVVAIGNGRQHRVGYMADAAHTRGFPSQFPTGNIHTHSANNNRHQLALAKAQAEIIYSFH